MCGIAGYIGKGPPKCRSAERTLSLMRKRGPDCQDSVSFSDRGSDIALLHSRLSIIDLDERANQPFILDGCTLVFNGEIYNYREIRRELEAGGVRFRTRSDTEVLMRAYLAYGRDCVDKFEGMWSFAVYDRNKGCLFLSRDRFAEKPLYYMETADGFYFGSEVKFIQSMSGERLNINYTHLYRYLVNGYKSLYKTSDTFYEQISELPYASCMIVTPQLDIDRFRYWNPNCSISDMTLAESIEGFRERLMKSVELRLRSDVPVAFCLSGGVDSAALVSIAAKEFDYNAAAFSIIDEDPRYNEYDNIMATVNDTGCRHNIIHISRKNTLERLKELVRYHDSPRSTITYLVNSMI